MQMNNFILLAVFTNLLIFITPSYADILPSSSSEGFISMGIEHAQSNNIRKTLNNQKSGYEQQADINVGYQNQSATNFSLIDYGISYSHYSESDIEDESDISGNLSINQQLFSENLQLDLSHFRHSYLLDQTLVDLPENSGNRDVFTVSPLWRLPYSKRAGFDTRYTYTAVRLSDDKDQNTDRNALSVAWYHDLSNKMTYRLSLEHGKVDFLEYDLPYEQSTVDMSLSGRLKAGSYLAKAGYSRLSVRERYEEGGVFQLDYQYSFQKNTLAMSLKRELTDSSLGLGENTPDSGDLDFDGTQLLWIDRVSLNHTHVNANQRFQNTNIIYYQQETPLVTRLVEARYGFSTQLSWKHTKLLTSRFNGGYSLTEVKPSGDKETVYTKLSADYQIHPKFFITVSAQYEAQINNEFINGYEELRLATGIRFTH